MGKYQSYAQKLDALARNRFAEYKTAKENFEKAEKALKNLPSSWNTAESRNKKIAAESDYKIAKGYLHDARENLQKTMDEVIPIRNELFAEVAEEWLMKPEDLDRNTVDLLNAGICSPTDIANLFNKATTATTKRFIAKFASEEVKRLPESMERTAALAAEKLLRNIAHQGDLYKDPNNADPVMRFDAATDVLRRSVKTTSLMDKWDEFTGEILSGM